MISDRAPQMKPWYFVPLVRHGNHFVQARDVSINAQEVTLESVLRSYISRHHTPRSAQVEIDGHLYTSTVFVPVSGDDYVYVLTDGNRVPIGAQLSPPIEPQAIGSYLRCLGRHLANSEGILREQVVDVRTGFIRPVFADLHPETADPSVSWDRFSKTARTVLLGEPGSGKTTCLRRMGLELVESASSRPSAGLDSIPVYIQLRDLAAPEVDDWAIRRQLGRLEGYELSEDFSELSRSGRFLLLFDGLDEVTASERETLVHSIHRICDEYPHNRVVISCRTAAYRWSFPEFTHLELQLFSDSQIKEWSCRSIYPRSSWRTFFTRLKESPDLFDLAHNPLVLSFAVSMFLRQLIMPYNVADLVEHLVKLLVEVWDSGRNVTRQQQDWAAPNRIYPVLSNLALNLRRTERWAFSAEEFGRWKPYSREQVSPEEMLSVLAECTGLLRRTAEGQWAFVHRAYAECLAGQHLVSSTLDVGVFLQGQLPKDSWQAILPYASALTADASHLLGLLVESAELAPSSKAKLIAEMLSQDMGVSESVLTRCCEVIAMELENLMGALVLADANEWGLATRTDTRPLWWMLFRHAGSPRLAEAEEAQALRALASSVYRARSGSAQRLLVERLQSSNIPSVRCLAEALEAEGEFEYVTFEHENQEYLLLSVNPESPEISV